MYEVCKHSREKNGKCLFAGISQGKIRCGKAADKVRFVDNYIDNFVVCFFNKSFSLKNKSAAAEKSIRSMQSVHRKKSSGRKKKVDNQTGELF